MKKLSVLFIALIFAGCAPKTSSSDDLASIQILDRNGFSETISAKERLNKYQTTNFLAAQPYQKVVRVFGAGGQSKSTKITTYHSNSQPWQYLEIENGRAHGKFREWHPNGQLKIEAFVIEGTPDVSEMAQMTWFFEGTNLVYDDQGHQIAKIYYEKGLLEGKSSYFYPSGVLEKEIPYEKDLPHGLVQMFDEQSVCVEKMFYSRGEKEGSAAGYWKPEQLKYAEEYKNGLLLQAEYFAPSGEIAARIKNGEGRQAIFEGAAKEAKLASLIEYRNGIVEGAIENFDPEGRLVSLYHIKDDMKNGEEWEYYPSNDKHPHPKLCLQWQNDVVQGTVKTWFENGVLQSQREMHENKKHGLAFGWFKEGDLMLMEEYDNDLLMKGSYYKKWDKTPISKIENGKGVAHLYDKEGKFLKKAIYEKGLPQNES
jgi:antitoxin component YwqK of YwqJK toxin-antitoxin module